MHPAGAIIQGLLASSRTPDSSRARCRSDGAAAAADYQHGDI